MHKGVKKLIWAGVLAGLSFLIPFAIIVPLIINEIKKEDVLLRGDASHEFTVEEPHSYTVWNHLSGLYEGESFSFEGDLPEGIQFKLQNLDSGELLDLESYTSASTSSNEVTIKRSVLTVEITAPGTYLLSITGNNHGRIFSIRESFVDNLLVFIGSFFGVMILCFCAMTAAVVLGIVGVVDLASKPKQESVA